MPINGNRKNIVILVMGPTGSGKSTFINYLGGENDRMPVESRMPSATRNVKSVSFDLDNFLDVDYPHLRGYRLTLVDMPGFDGKNNFEIITCAKQQLKSSTHIFGGIIYLQDVSIDRLDDAARAGPNCLWVLSACKNIVLGTTKWSRATQSGDLHEKELKDGLWQPLISEGAKICPFRDSDESAWELVNSLLESLDERLVPLSKHILVLVMGASGSGKSTFINTLLGQDVMRVKHSTVSRPTEVEMTPVDTRLCRQLLENDNSCDKEYRLVIAEAPGFDDTPEGGIDISQRITEWLGKPSAEGPIFGGIIYLQDISRNRFDGTAKRNMEVLQSLFGIIVPDMTVLVTTMWAKGVDGTGYQNETELKEVHWKGSMVQRFTDNQNSALEIVKSLIKPLRQRPLSGREEIRLPMPSNLIRDGSTGAFESLLVFLRQFFFTL